MTELFHLVKRWIFEHCLLCLSFKVFAALLTLLFFFFQETVSEPIEEELTALIADNGLHFLPHVSGSIVPHMKALFLGFLLSGEFFFGNVIRFVLHSTGHEELLCNLLELFFCYKVFSPAKQEFYFLFYFLTTHIELLLVLIDILLEFWSNSQVRLAAQALQFIYNNSTVEMLEPMANNISFFTF